MSDNIYLEGEGLTNLQLFVGVLTQFTPPEGDLCCRIAVILAEDHHAASIISAVKYPQWEIQALTNLSALSWFKWITLDPNCPQVQSLREFIIQDIEAVPDDDEGTFKRHHLPGQGA